MGMQILPHDIVVDVLSRLPVKSLLRFKCVCKLWHSLISDTQFVKMHLNRSIQDVNINSRRLLLVPFRGLLHATYPIPLQSIACDDDDDDDDDAALMLDYPFRLPYYRIKFLGSCYGLICLVTNLYNFILWNPSTRDAMELPKTSSVSHISVFAFGLGYDSSIDDFKVLRIVRAPGTIDEEVYSLKTNSWRRISGRPSTDVLKGHGVFSNGALHWLSIRRIGRGISFVVVSFDLAAEQFQEVVPLPNHDYRPSSISGLRVLGGYLSVLYCYANYFEIWVMKEYGVKASWTKLFTIPSKTVTPYSHDSYDLSPLCFLKKDEVMINLDAQNLQVYNLKDKTFRNLKTLFPSKFETVIYVESLVSPNAMVVTGQSGIAICQA